MEPTRPRIFYFRSLDTAGNESFKVGPFDFGTFSNHFEREFKGSALDFVPVIGMGGGPIEQQAELAKEFLKKDPAFQKKMIPIHFFGHSMGGLVAKIVAQDPKFQRNLKSLITIGTPHRNCTAAKLAANLREVSPTLAFCCRVVGYDLSLKKPTFESLCKADELEDRFPDDLITGSIVCAPPRKKWSWFFQWINQLPLIKQIEQPSDGLISKSSQIFGKYQWEFDLDHMQQIGFGGQTEEFKRLCRFLEEFWIKSVSRTFSDEKSLSRPL